MLRIFLGVLVLAAIIVALSGCSSEKSAAVPSGKWAVLHPGQWDIDPALVQQPIMPVPR